MALELVNTAVEAVVDLVTDRASPAGKDRQGHGSRSSPDRSDHGSDRRADLIFVPKGLVVSGNMAELDQVHGMAVAVFRKGDIYYGIR